MHSVFAVEPEALNTWSNFRYLIEKFGFPNGVLIARYPKTWMKLVIEACEANNVGEVERLKIVEKLQQTKTDRMLNRKALPFDKECSWLNNAIKPEVFDLFDGFIVSEKQALVRSYPVDDIPEEVFHDLREKKVARDAVSLASAARSLLVDAKELILIDPYLKPKIQCTKLLSEFIQLATDVGKGFQSLTIHVDYSKDPKPLEEVRADYQRLLRNEIEDGLNIQVIRWHDQEFDFHARYLLTDQRHGLRYDRGFIEPSDLEERAYETDVACLERAMVSQLFQCYQLERDEKFITDLIVVA